MRLDKGTLLIAAAAVMVAVVLGMVGGVVPGVLVAVAAGVASTAVWQVATGNRTRSAARAARLKEAQRTYASPVPVHKGGVARYLRAEAEVVPFWSRAELGELISWLASERHLAVQLLTGEGGTGKTRLALRLAEKASEIGWRSQWVSAGTEDGAVGAARDAGEPVLLVVDYAETRSGLQGLLYDVLNDASGPDMLVLLVARSAGEWWQQLINSSGYQLSELLAAVQPITLGRVSERSGEQEVFHDALVAFAAELGVACPGARIALSGAGAVILVIHAAALLAILDNAPPAESAAGAPRRREEVLAGLLRHEARYWQQSLAARNLALDPEVARRAVAAGCLIGADDEASASKLLAAIPDLTSSAQQRGQVARWLHDLYPVPLSAAPQREWVGPLSPDLIVEQLVVSVLTQHPDLILALFTGLTDSRAIRGLTVLARAALTDPVAADQLDVALRSDLEHLVVPALAVAVETNSAVGDLIKDALSSTVLSVDVLEGIAAALPNSSFALAETAVIVLERLADESLNDTGERARWLVGLANWRRALGRREDALAASEEAVTIYRQLAQTRPDALLPDLAGSLNSQSVCLSDLGRREDALASIEEALTIYQQLAQTEPDAFSRDCALSLNNQAACLSSLGRREEALAAIEEAVAIYRQLAQTRPDAFLPNLATSLNNRSSGLSDLGRREDALAASEEAVTICRRLIEARPHTFLPDLAGSLVNQSGRLLGMGRREAAVAASEEAVAIYGKLAETRPDAFLPNLAMSLNDQSACLSELGRRQDGLAAIEEALAIYRRLAEARPDAFLPNLAMSLSNQSDSLLGLGRGKAAVAASEEAVTIYGKLAQARPDAFLPNLAMSLNNQSNGLSDLGRQQDALAAIQEAVDRTGKSGGRYVCELVLILPDSSAL